LARPRYLKELLVNQVKKTGGVDEQGKISASSSWIHQLDVKLHKCKILGHRFSVDDYRTLTPLIAMRFLRIRLTTLLGLVAILTINDSH
jgi:hypothetical protein